MSGRLQAQELFVRRLKARRGELGLSQHEVARRAGINRSFLSEVERGQVNISIPKADQVAKALGLSLSEMIAGGCT